MLRIPYPDATSELAKLSHMFICIAIVYFSCELLKCQTFKPYHLDSGSQPERRIIERPDVTRNPFRHPTIIDLDKVFVVSHALLPDSLKAAKGINDTLYLDICNNVDPAISRIFLPDDDLRSMNYRL